MPSSIAGENSAAPISLISAYALVMIVLAAGLCGCAGFGGAQPTAPQYDSDDTRDLVAALNNANEQLVAGKWIGKVSITVDGQRRTFDRAVWAAADPGRVRFDARTPFGLPVMSLACNESHLTVRAHNQGKYYRKHVGTNSLGQLFPVDISCRDLYRLLTGRPPIIDYSSARMETTATGAQAIRLNRRFKGTVATLFLDADSGGLSGVELLDIHGNRRYQARLAGRRMVEGFSLPMRLHFESAKGQLDIEMVRLYPNRPVTPSLFQIAPPN